MPAPAIASVSIGRVLETITAQDVQDGVLDHLDRRRKIGDEMMFVAVEADDDGVGQKVSERLIGVPCGEKFFIDVWQTILLKAANGLAGLEDGAADFIGIKFDEGSVAFLNFDNAVLDHGWSIEAGELRVKVKVREHQYFQATSCSSCSNFTTTMKRASMNVETTKITQA
jgi:hypothetical protein